MIKFPSLMVIKVDVYDVHCIYMYHCAEMPYDKKFHVLVREECRLFNMYYLHTYIIVHYMLYDKVLVSQVINIDY